MMLKKKDPGRKSPPVCRQSLRPGRNAAELGVCTELATKTPKRGE